MFCRAMIDPPPKNAPRERSEKSTTGEAARLSQIGEHDEEQHADGPEPECGGRRASERNDHERQAGGEKRTALPVQRGLRKRRT